tara:strand:- start:1404 stop:1577 length:174 start_codon:yes stop_codon:yes gene_type:complete
MKTEEIKITKKEIKERPNDKELGAYVRNKLKKNPSYQILIDEADNIVIRTYSNEFKV